MRISQDERERTMFRRRKKMLVPMPIARDEMDKVAFDAMMGEGLVQAKAG